MSLPVAAESSGSLQTGYSFTNNLGSQRTVNQGLGISDAVSRSGWVNQGKLVLQSLKPDGGQTLAVFYLFDKSNNTSSDIKDLALSASLFRALNAHWLWRFSGNYELHRYDAVLASSYDGYGANLTFGYFGKNKQGLDLTLAWKYEDHSKDPLFQYTTDRVWLNLKYYLPQSKDTAVWSIQAQVRRNDANGDLRSFNSLLLGLNVDNWQWGDLQGSAGLQWRNNYYDDPINITTTTNNTSLSTKMHNMPGFNMPGGDNGGNGSGGSTVTTQDVNDQLLSTFVAFSIPLSKHWRGKLSADTGRYTVSTNTEAQNYYLIYSGVQWDF